MTGHPENNLLRIADVARLANLSRHTIQYYLMLGLVKETQRTPGGHRLFDHHAVQRVKLVHHSTTAAIRSRKSARLFLVIIRDHINPFPRQATRLRLR